MDEEFQESDIIDEEFEHEGVEEEDPSQGFVDWDTPPIYQDEQNQVVETCTLLQINGQEDRHFGCLIGEHTNQQKWQ